MRRGFFLVTILLIILVLLARFPLATGDPHVAGQFKEVALTQPSATPTPTVTPTPTHTPTPLPAKVIPLTPTLTPTPESSRRVAVGISGNERRLSISVHNDEVTINGERVSKEEWKKRREEWKKQVRELRQRLHISLHTEE